MKLLLRHPKTIKVVSVIAFACVATLVFWLLHHELREINYQELLSHIKKTPVTKLFYAAVLAALSYLVLTGYDYFGLRYAGKPLPYKKTAFASFISYCFSHNIGLALFSSMAFRYRFYSVWNLSILDITKVTLFCGTSFWLGFLSIGGITFLLSPPTITTSFITIPPAATQLIGAALCLGTLLYLILCYKVRTPLRIRQWEVSLPSPRLSLIQAGLSALDWLFASGVLYVLFRGTVDVSYPEFMSTYILAILLGAVSHIPAGLGVIETVFLIKFSGAAPADVIFGTLLIYRLVYYFAPLGLAMLMLGVFEFAKATGHLRSFLNSTKRWFPLVIPRLFSVMVFAAGVILLISGTTPTAIERRRWLEQHLPLPFLEASHFLGSITGVALLIIARALQRRLDGAYLLSLYLLLAGVTFSLVKGFDYEEAAFLLLVFALLYPCRSYFYRRASLLEGRLSPGWLGAIVLTVASSIWMGFFAYKHAEYSNELWWSFTFSGDAPRALRAMFGSVMFIFAMGLIYLLKPSKISGIGTKSISPEITQAVHNSPKSYANLAFLGDKLFLVNDSKNAFIMYGCEGQSWISMGDPIGPEIERKELIWSFRDQCDRHGVHTVFYQIDAENLHHYVETGLSLLKLGEEAVVDLDSFSLEGKHRKSLRNTINHLTKDGFEFEVIPTAQQPAILSDLRMISTEWLFSKNTSEKRFSLGYFSEEYLAHFPIAIIKKEQQIVAFANLWETACKSELSIDLMRYSQKAPPSVMDFLFCQLMLWGQTQSYKTFNLGMAPLSGMNTHPLAPKWNRMSATLFRYGEHFYNFKGLRQYKEKFDPKWTPKFLASPAGLALPGILANIAALISGGIRKTFMR